MQVGRVVLVMTEDESSRLLQLLESSLFVNYSEQNTANEFISKIKNANKTIFIDDFRPDKIGSLPE
jgi:type III secretory pathway lipoprotein EscJ